MRFDLVEDSGHRVDIMEDEQVGDEVVVLDNLDLLVADVFLDEILSEIGPFGELIPFDISCFTMVDL